MKLKTVILKNFRIYQEETRIPVSDLTAFIGKNDSGKSSILEALEIFFNQNVVKLDRQDLSVGSGDNRNIVIGCVLTDLPDELVLDQSATTTLGEEYLLNEDGCLEIHKVFDCSTAKIKESVHARANHPTNDGLNDLLGLKHSELKRRLAEREVDASGVDQRANPSIRKALWRNGSPLTRQMTEISLDKEDGKKIWDALRKHMPTYALFQSDRSSRDDDSEVQDPMKLAIAEALRGVQAELDRVMQSVKDKATEVASRTLTKLREMDPTLASQLSPEFKAEPKWDGLFKLSLTGDNEIPINKRGSGVRRLVLLSFFRAEAERRQQEAGSPGVIYAIEEPETSQHPTNQKLIVNVLSELANQDSCQVLITTHVPGLAGLIPVQCVAYVHQTDGGRAIVSEGDDEVLANVAKDLGVLPDNRIKVLACVEGPNDIAFFRNISRILHDSDATIPDLTSHPEVALLPLGGSTLQQWVDNQYLKGFGRPEVHIYDRGTDSPPKFAQYVEQINQRGDDSYAVLTGKRETENYLHPEAIEEGFAVRVTFSPTDNVPELVARAVRESDSTSRPWDELEEEKREKKISQAKRRLNEVAAARMTVERIREADPNGDIENWLREIASRTQSSHAISTPPDGEPAPELTRHGEGL